MPIKRRIRPRVGDIFTISLTPERCGYGQIVAGERVAYYMVAFKYSTVSGAPFKAEEVLASPILFIGTFMDVLIKIGRWKVLGNATPQLDRIPFPCYRVKVNDDYYVESWDMTKRRLATEIETAYLDNRTHYSPMHLEAALRAYYDLGPKPPSYEQLTTEHVRDRSNIAF